jgi:hypothetical protein
MIPLGSSKPSEYPAGFPMHQNPVTWDDAAERVVLPMPAPAFLNDLYRHRRRATAHDLLVPAFHLWRRAIADQQREGAQNP